MNKVKNPSDKYRCEYFAKMIISYSEFLNNKSTLLLNYSDFIDGSYSLNNYFKKNISKSPL